MFPISNAGETIIDSGTTLAYIVEEVYDWIISVVSLCSYMSLTVRFDFFGEWLGFHYFLAMNFMIIIYSY